MSLGLAAFDWQEGAACASPINQDFASKAWDDDDSVRRSVIPVCDFCPIKRACLKWALEHNEIEGVWGGLDQIELRAYLSVSSSGQESRNKPHPGCPACHASVLSLWTVTVVSPNGGRWAKKRLVFCEECGFEWKSRTSANAVDAFYKSLAEIAAE